MPLCGFSYILPKLPLTISEIIPKVLHMNLVVKHSIGGGELTCPSNTLSHFQSNGWIWESTARWKSEEKRTWRVHWNVYKGNMVFILRFTPRKEQVSIQHWQFLDCCCKIQMVLPEGHAWHCYCQFVTAGNKNNSFLKSKRHSEYTRDWYKHSEQV